ncbi:MAG: YqcC family protein [Gammaproteobacteria bacterium]
MVAERSEIASLLNAVEFEMRRLLYWLDTPPSAEELSSALPFCCDTLEFPQWLQFIFLHKMRLLLKAGAPLPTACAIAPYAEEYFKQGNKEEDVLLNHLRAIDKLLTTN